MTIPNFKSNQDWETFTSLFDARWHYKKALLDRVKDDMFPGYNWDQIQGQTLVTINDIVQQLLYDVEYTFKESHLDYKTEDDDIFIPRKNFRESVTEALLEANQKFWNSANDSTEHPHDYQGPLYAPHPDITKS